MKMKLKDFHKLMDQAHKKLNQPKMSYYDIITIIVISNLISAVIAHSM